MKTDLVLDNTQVEEIKRELEAIKADCAMFSRMRARITRILSILNYTENSSQSQEKK